MKKVICFSMWGDNPKYTVGGVENADLALDIYPDWVCRYYVGKSVPDSIINELKVRPNTEVLIMNEEGNWEGMFWRFYAASDPSVDVMMSRDTDSRVDEREKLAVDEWLASDKDFHIMRDHPLHYAPILGGMWGVRNRLLFNIYDLIKEYTKGDYWQVDQNFLRDIIYPRVVDNAFAHDEFFNAFGPTHPFPHKRSEERDEKGYPVEFVGKPYEL